MTNPQRIERVEAGDLRIKDDAIVIGTFTIPRAQIIGASVTGTGDRVSFLQALKGPINLPFWAIEIRTETKVYQRTGLTGQEAASAFDRMGYLALRGSLGDGIDVLSNTASRERSSLGREKGVTSASTQSGPFDTENAHAFLSDLDEILEDREENLRKYRPNSDKAIADKEKSLFFLGELREFNHILISELESETNLSERENRVRSLVELYYAKLLEWPESNADEIVDGIARTGLVGICLALGAVLGYAQLVAGVGVVIFGGKSVGKAIGTALRQGN